MIAQRDGKLIDDRDYYGNTFIDPLVFCVVIRRSMTIDSMLTRVSIVLCFSQATVMLSSIF